MRVCVLLEVPLLTSTAKQPTVEQVSIQIYIEKEQVKEKEQEHSVQLPLVNDLFTVRLVCMSLFVCARVCMHHSRAVFICQLTKGQCGDVNLRSQYFLVDIAPFHSTKMYARAFFFPLRSALVRYAHMFTKLFYRYAL